MAKAAAQREREERLGAFASAAQEAVVRALLQLLAPLHSCTFLVVRDDTAATIWRPVEAQRPTYVLAASKRSALSDSSSSRQHVVCGLLECVTAWSGVRLQQPGRRVGSCRQLHATHTGTSSSIEALGGTVLYCHL